MLYNSRGNILQYWSHSRPIDHITNGEIKAFLYKKLKSKSGSTVKQYKYIVSGIFTIAIERGIIEHIPVLGIIIDKSSNFTVELFNTDEINQLLGSLRGIEHYPLIISFDKAAVNIYYSVGKFKNLNIVKF